jgi:hypothetical protein
MTTALEGGEGSASCPCCSLPLGKTRYPLYRRLGGPQSQSGQVWKISPPPGFDPQTVQPVASCYTDWNTRPTESRVNPWNILCSYSWLNAVFTFLKVHCMLNFAKIGIEYYRWSTYTYVQQSPVAIHTQTHWHLISHSIPAPLPVFLPVSVFLPPLSDCTFLSARTKLVYVSGGFKAA